MHQATEIKRHQEGNETSAKQPGRTQYTDLRIEFAQKQKGQQADTVMRSRSLHLKAPKDHPKMLTDMLERHEHMLNSSWKHHEYVKHLSEI